MKYLAFDVETTGLDPYRGAKIFSYATCDETYHTQRYRKDFEKPLQELLDDTSIIKICHNFHFELSLLKFTGYHIPEDTQWHDTMLMSQLLNNLEPSHGLDRLIAKYGNEEYNKYDNDISKAAKIYGSYDKIPDSLMRPYQEMDVIRTMMLFKMFFSKILAQPSLDYQNEIDLVKQTIAMESRGIILAKAEAEKLLSSLQVEIEQTQTDFHQRYGNYNLGSTKHMGKLLYKDLKIPVLYYTKNDAPALDKETLEELRPRVEKHFPQHLAIFDMILKYRSYVRGVTTIQSYKDACSKEGILHPHINTNRAQTGRQSSENPNMQNISKESVLKNRFPVKSRVCFRARPGYVLLLADYAGIEMRLIAELSGEPELIKLIQKNGDPHSLAAGLFYGKLFTECDDLKRKKDLRSSAKNAQFALAYGAMPEKIADTLGMDFVKVESGIIEYQRRFPLVANFTRNVIHKVKKQGYVETPFGRRLYVRQDKPYSGSNYIIQGTAAGILKRAQVRVFEYLKKTKYDIHQLLTIHDEIIFEYPRSLLQNKKEILSKIKKEMTYFPEIKVPLDIEWKLSTYTWAEAKEIKV
jgi:DNA polymerase I